jgi:hypothetical protein
MNRLSRAKSPRQEYIAAVRVVTSRRKPKVAGLTHGFAESYAPTNITGKRKHALPPIIQS